MKLFEVQVGMRTDDEMSSITNNVLAADFESACIQELRKYMQSTSSYKWVDGRLYSYDRATETEYLVGAHQPDGSLCE